MIVKLLLTNLGSMYDKCIHQVQSFGVDGYNILMPAPSVLNVWISLRRTSEMAGFSLLAQIEPPFPITHIQLVGTAQSRYYMTILALTYPLE